MINLSFLKGQSFAILGLGKSGLATAAALKAAASRPLLWDDNPALRSEAIAAGYEVVDFLKHGFRDAQAVIQSPGIPHLLPQPHPVSAAAKAIGLPILIDIDLLYRANPNARYVGITGTNGKSTTTALIHHILTKSGQEAVIGGNFGPPALSLPMLGNGGIYVMELSSYQLELAREFSCDVAILLNLTPDHLDRHGDMNGYLAAKTRIFRRGARNQHFIVGVDDEWCVRAMRQLESDNCALTRISGAKLLPKGVSYHDGGLYEGSRNLLDMTDAPGLPGAHNGQNAAAAYAACRALGVEIADTIAGIEKFPGLAHRQQTVATISNIRFINDSKATNADAAAKALGCYGEIYWIAGGRPKAGGLNGLEPFMPNVRHAFLIGEAAAQFGEWLQEKAETTQCGDLDTAVRQAADMALAENRKGAVVLLSPACASFDQFPNFEARGERFASLAAEIGRRYKQGGAT